MRTATCLACGFEGRAPSSPEDRHAEVAMTLAEYSDPIAVSVTLFSNESHRGAQPDVDHRQVPGIYGAETRCTDRAACADRQRAQKPTWFDR